MVAALLAELMAFSHNSVTSSTVFAQLCVFFRCVSAIPLFFRGSAFLPRFRGSSAVPRFFRVFGFHN